MSGFIGIGVAPQLETAIHAVNVRETLPDQIGRCALAGVTVIADHNKRFIQVGFRDEIGNGKVIQMLRTRNVIGGKCLLVTDIDQDRTLFE